MMRISWFLVATVAFPRLALCDDNESLLRAELAQLNLASPEADAARDIAAKKLQCFSVDGYARYFPGVDADSGEQFCNLHERHILGTSDYGSREEEKLKRAAISYAERYNRFVLAHQR